MGYSSWATLNAVTQGDFIKAPTTIDISSNPDPLEADLLPVITVSGFSTQNGASDNHIATRYTIVDSADGTIMWSAESTTNLLSITMTGTPLLPSTDYKCIVAFKGAIYGWGASATKLFLSENIEVLAPVVTGTYPNIVISTPTVDNGTGTETFTMEFKITDNTGALVAEITGVPYTSNVDLDSIHNFEPDTLYTVCIRLVGSISGASDYTCTTFTTPKIVIDTFDFPNITFPPPPVVAPDSHTGTKVVITDGTGTPVCTKNITSGNLLEADVSSCPLNPDTDYTVCITYEFSQTADRTYCNTIHTPAAAASIEDPTFTISGELNNVTKNPTITGSAPVVTNATFSAMEVEVTGGSTYFGVSPNWTTHYIASDLANNASYTIKVRYKAVSTLNNSVIYSNWATKSVTTNYTVAATISTPTFTVSGETNNVPKNAIITVSQPVITGGATLQYTEWDYSGATTGGGAIYDTSNIVANTPDLTNNSSYTIKVRYIASGGLISNWATKSVTTNYTVATVIHPTCDLRYPDVQLSAGETRISDGCTEYIGAAGTETVVIPQDKGGTAVSNTVEAVELPFLTGAYRFTMDTVNSYVRYYDSGALRDAVTIRAGSNNVKVKCGSNSNLFAVNNGTLQRWRYYMVGSEAVYVPSDNFDIFGSSTATNDVAQFSYAARGCTADQSVADIRIDNVALADLRFTASGSTCQIKPVGSSIPIVTVSVSSGQLIQNKTVTYDNATSTITIGTTVIATDTIVS